MAELALRDMHAILCKCFPCHQPVPVCLLLPWRDMHAILSCDMFYINMCLCASFRHVPP
jgi:hypothetical protein